MDKGLERVEEIINKLYSKYPDLDVVDKMWELGVKESVESEIPMNVLAMIAVAISGKQIDLPYDIAEYVKAKEYKEKIEDDIKDIVDCIKGRYTMSDGDKQFIRENLKGDIVLYICLKVLVCKMEYNDNTKGIHTVLKRYKEYFDKPLGGDEMLNELNKMEHILTNETDAQKEEVKDKKKDKEDSPDKSERVEISYVIPTDSERTYFDIVDTSHMICKLLISKRKDYGNAFHDSFKDYGITVSEIRLADKLNRLKNLTKGKGKDPQYESIEDTLKDIAGYAILTLIELKRQKWDETAKE